jgi:protein O-GlcNAc transferase
VNKPLIQAWARILAAVPASRIMLKSASFKFPETVDRVLECFEDNGVDPWRVELQGWMRHRREHLTLYDSVDIALDTFPYNGTTTTCEALWMGVPVVSQAGGAHMSRVGAAILQCVGLREYVAHSTAGYIEIAVALANDPVRRRTLRAHLRPTLVSSPLLDHEGFTRKLECHYWQKWTDWCERQHVSELS